MDVVVSLNRTRVELKPHSPLSHGWYSHRFESNQSGIETLRRSFWNVLFLFVWIEPEWNWNYPEMGSGAPVFIVWIEPEWNWNAVFCGSSGISPGRLNRTRVELKHNTAWRCILPIPVWIEPEWNWNAFYFYIQRPVHTVWIEPEWNWNAIQPYVFMEVVEFESNQSGIETWKVLLSTWMKIQFESNQSGIETVGYIWWNGAKMSLNRTRVELKPHSHRWLRRVSQEFESNQSGIETKRFRFYQFRVRGLNRTRVELKLVFRAIRGRSGMSLNRTRVELKPPWS